MSKVIYKVIQTSEEHNKKKTPHCEKDMRTHAPAYTANQESYASFFLCVYEKAYAHFSNSATFNT